MGRHGTDELRRSHPVIGKQDAIACIIQPEPFSLIMAAATADDPLSALLAGLRVRSNVNPEDGSKFFWDYTIAAFPVVYMDAGNRGEQNAKLLQQAVLDGRVKLKLVNMMRRVHAQRKRLKVTLLGGGPCLETEVIRQLVEDLQLEPKLEIDFSNYDKVPDWQAGHPALTVPVKTSLCDLVEVASNFWKALGQQHIVIAWYVHEALCKSMTVQAAAMYPGAAHSLSNGVTDGPCFLMGGQGDWGFEMVLTAGELAHYGLSKTSGNCQIIAEKFRKGCWHRNAVRFKWQLISPKY